MKTTIIGVEGVGIWKEDKAIIKIILDTATEIVQIANTKEISLPEKDIRKTMDSFGKPSKLENFNGYIVKQGKLLGIKTPTNSFIYHCLLPQEKKARQNM